MEYFYVDLIALGIIILSAIIGLKKGFFATLLSLLGFVGTFILAYFFNDEIMLLFEKLFGVKTWLVNTLGESVGGIVGTIAAIIVTYILIRILVFIINHTIGKLFKGKVLGGINSFLGFFLGLLKGAAFVLIALIVLNIASLIPSVKTWADGVFNETYVIGYVYDFVGDSIGEYLNPDEKPADEPPADPEGS
ncbi:MAG: CvpA family protein [Clostridia bacterium]|nr:CvpA family protein [Clostridia bacterium]